MTAFRGGCAAAELAYVTAFDCSTTHPDAVAVADTDLASREELDAAAPHLSPWRSSRHGADSTPSHSPAD